MELSLQTGLLLNLVFIKLLSLLMVMLFLHLSLLKIPLLVSLQTQSFKWKKLLKESIPVVHHQYPKDRVEGILFVEKNSP